MKKTLMVLVLAALVLLPAFSASGYLGVTTGPSFAIEKLKSSSSYSNSSTSSFGMNYNIGVKSVTYFTKIFGMGLALDIDVPLSRSLEGNKVPNFDYYPYAITTYSPALTFEFKYSFTEQLELQLGTGVSMSFGSKGTGKIDDFTPDKEEIKDKCATLNFVADLGVSYDVLEKMAVRGGLKISAPMFSNYSTGSSRTDSSLPFSVSGVYLIPYAGIAFSY